MAKSPTEQLRDVSVQLAMLTERDAAREEALLQLRDELDRKRDDRVRLIEKEREERVRLQVENAALKQQLQDHLAQYQEWDRRRWGLIVLLIGAVLSLTSGLIVSLSRK